MRLYAFAFFVSSLRVSRRGNERKDRLERRLLTKIAASALTIAVKFSPCSYMYGELGVARLIDAVPRNDAAPGSVTVFATHNTVGNSSLPRLTMLLLGQYAPRRERGPRCDIVQENASLS